jgi:hypothetical protein
MPADTITSFGSDHPHQRPQTSHSRRAMP